MTVNKNIGLYKRAVCGDIQRGELKAMAELEKNLSPAIDLNYRRLLPEKKDARILDIGCGWGYFLYYLKKKGYSDIRGVDLKEQEKRLQFVKRHICGNADAVENLAEYLALHRSEFDLIVLKQVVYYFERGELLHILRRINEALRPGGRLLVEVFNGGLLTAAFIQNIDYQRRIIFTEYSLANLLQDAGFELEDLFGMVFPLKKNFRSLAWSVVQRVWVILLKSVYFMERGSDPKRRPHIFSRHIIAVAKNKAGE